MLTDVNQIHSQNLQKVMGLGIAGNFAGHLEQAGETPDFVAVETESATAPKGLFPFYIPHSATQVGEYPFCAKFINYPENLQQDAHLQAEPEVCVLFNIQYEFGKIAKMTPKAFAAFNDCSIRKPGAKKISEKKNWGANTKGVSDTFLAVNSLNPGAELDAFRIASFLKRDNHWQAYGNDSAVNSYSYFHQKLMDWMQDKINHQADFGPLENLNQIIHSAGFPQQILISLGATTYTPFGETTTLQIGDELAIYVYNATQIDAQMIEKHLHQKESLPAGEVSILQQKVV